LLLGAAALIHAAVSGPAKPASPINGTMLTIHADKDTKPGRYPVTIITKQSDCKMVKACPEVRTQVILEVKRDDK
jgi:hypothetical protein